MQTIHRAGFLVLHRRLALAFAPLLLLQALTGAVLLFKMPLGQVLDPAGMSRMTGSGTAPISTLAASAARSFPGWRVTRISYPASAGDIVFAQLSRSGGSMRYVSLDPGSAQVLATGTIWRFPVEAALQVHYRLLDGQTGMAIVLANGLALALLGGTGLGTWWPGRGRMTVSLKIRAAAPRRVRLRHWHRSIGVALSAVLLFSATTGAMLVAPDLIAAPAPPAQGSLPGPAALDRALAIAVAEFPRADIRDVRFPAANRIDVNFRAPHHNSQVVDIVSVNTSDGTVLKRLKAGNNPVLWMKILPLHSGTALGLPGPLLLLMAAMALMILALTGPVMWWHARRPNRRKP